MNNKIQKPQKISILLAVYKPNLKWLKEQLISLNNQTYPNLKLFVYNDCVSEPIDEGFVKKYVTKFDVDFIYADKNRGSNYAFEKLTEIADGDYFAYCDQDDIWFDDKLYEMHNKIIKENSVMVCCDMQVIDAYGNVIASKISDIYKWHEFYDEENVTKKLIAKNFVTGCAMMVKSQIAKESLPFLKHMYHDAWLGIYASTKGKISIIYDPLIKYRIHGGNQTSVNNNGVTDKQSYYLKIIAEPEIRIKEIVNRLKDLDKVILDYSRWIKARKIYNLKPNFKDLLIMIKYRNFGVRQVLFESLLFIIPNFVVKNLIKLSKEGRI